MELAYNRFRYYDPEEGRYISQDPLGLLSGEFGFYNYVEDTNAWIDVFGLAKTYAQKKAWKDAREAYWKKEAKKNKKNYSDHNLDRMKSGKAPQMEVIVRNRKTGDFETKKASMELHHKKAQHKGGSNKSSNLQKVNPWEHEAVDEYRHTGSDLIDVVQDVGSFGG
nr:RHS repeat-associated core domain-containing protein [Flavobacterium sp. 140616W15]